MPGVQRAGGPGFMVPGLAGTGFPAMHEISTPSAAEGKRGASSLGQGRFRGGSGVELAALTLPASGGLHACMRSRFSGVRLFVPASFKFPAFANMLGSLPLGQPGKPVVA